MISTTYSGSRCSHCKDWSFWCDSRLIEPAEAPIELPHEDLPADCVADYEEAREIFARSPRGAAALLRLVVQKLLPHLGQDGKNINNNIAELVAAGLPVQVQQALDFCRVVGNNAVHPGEIQLDDTPDMAEQLFSMINFIVQDRIARPKEIAEKFKRLPESAKAAIAKRDE